MLLFAFILFYFSSANFGPAKIKINVKQNKYFTAFILFYFMCADGRMSALTALGLNRPRKQLFTVALPTIGN